MVTQVLSIWEKTTFVTSSLIGQIPAMLSYLLSAFSFQHHKCQHRDGAQHVMKRRPCLAYIWSHIYGSTFCPQTDRRTDGQGDTSIPPFQLRWSGGIINSPIHWRVWASPEWDKQPTSRNWNFTKTSIERHIEYWIGSQIETLVRNYDIFYSTEEYFCPKNFSWCLRNELYNWKILIPIRYL